MSRDSVWSPDRIEFVRRLWVDGLSTNEISKKCTNTWGREVSKNAIVGKVHRQKWDGRPSPIIREIIHDENVLAQTPKPKVCRAAPCPPPGGYPLPTLACLTEPPPPTPDPVVFTRADPVPPPVARDPNRPLYRKDGTGCLAIKGEDPDTTVCGGPLYSLSKPYCLECAKLYYKFAPKTNKQGIDYESDRRYSH